MASGFIKTTTNPKHGTYSTKGPGLASRKTIGGSTTISVGKHTPAKIGLDKASARK